MGTLQLTRGTVARWTELNPVLAVGEPGFEYDTGKLKVGDGSTPWRKLHYIGANELYCVATFSELPAIGNEECLYKVSDAQTLYQWNTTDNKYEPLNSGGSFDPSIINLINGGNANGRN